MIRLCLAILLWANAAAAQVVVDPDRSAVRDGWWRLEVSLGLGAIVPYRVFTLDDPRRLVLDFEGVDFSGIDPQSLLDADRATAIRTGPLRPGWSRMVIDLAEPLVVDQAGMVTTPDGAQLDVVLKQATAEEFAAASGTPPDPGWEPVTTLSDTVAGDISPGDFIVVLDPGHGGIDPGALKGGIKEADLMLVMAAEMAVVLNDLPGVSAVLTRDGDTFVPLMTRMALARDLEADLFISLHADALEDETVRGATVYTLSEDGGDAATQRLVERHEVGDVLAGADLTGVEDRVAAALLNLARTETGPAARRFAQALVSSMGSQGVQLNARPLREGQFTVLSAVAFPSVLLEVGFLSNREDRAVLATREGRARIIRAVADTVALMAR